MCKEELRNTVRVTPITLPIAGHMTKLSAKARKGAVVELSFSDGCGSFMSNPNIVAVAQMEVDRKS